MSLFDLKAEEVISFGVIQNIRTTKFVGFAMTRKSFWGLQKSKHIIISENNNSKGIIINFITSRD